MENNERPTVYFDHIISYTYRNSIDEVISGTTSYACEYPEIDAATAKAVVADKLANSYHRFGAPGWYGKSIQAEVTDVWVLTAEDFAAL